MDIYIAICNCMSEIGAIGKDQKNQQQGFMYRGVDDVMNALQPVLSKNKVFIVPEILEQNREEKTSKTGTALIYSIAKIKYTFYADDGSCISAIVIGEGMDSGDKSMNKAMSIAFKYACFQVFCIATKEMIDPDGESHELAPKDNSKHENKSADSAKSATQPTELEKRATAIFYAATGTKEGQRGWSKEDYKSWLKDLKEAGKITTDFGKKWTLEDIIFLETELEELPF